MNTDGASKGTPGVAGGGGFLGDNKGVCFHGFTVNIGIYNAFRAQLAAAKVGL